MSELELSEYLYQSKNKENIFGKTYQTWTEEWWKWLVNIDKDQNPAKDRSGRHANTDQRHKDVYFLAGEVEGKAKRTNVSIPGGKAILFPVVNYEWSFSEMLGLAVDPDKVVRGGTDFTKEEEEKLVEMTKEHADYMYSLDMMIDEGTDEELRLYTGQLCEFRMSSVFDLTFVKNNIFNTKPGKTRAAADGYWAFIKEDSLKRGPHSIWFRGITHYYSTEVNYSITIT